MELTKEQKNNKSGDNWNKYWCSHCRCQAGKENGPITNEIIIRNIKTKKERIFDRVCDRCLSNLGIYESSYCED